MSIPPTDPRYSSTGRPSFRARPKAAFAAFLLLLAVGVIALAAWWVF